MEIVEMDGTGARKQARRQASEIAGSPNRLSAQTLRLVMRGEGGPGLSLSLSLSPFTSQVSILEMNGGERMGKWDGKFRAFLRNGRGSRRKKDCGLACEVQYE